MTNLLNYLLSPWCRVLLEKLTCLQLVKKFTAFHETRRFITALTSVRHLSLYWASPVQSIYPHPTFWRSALILSTQLHLGLPSGFFPSGFSTKTLYTPTSPHPYAPHAQPISWIKMTPTLKRNGGLQWGLNSCGLGACLGEGCSEYHNETLSSTKGVRKLLYQLRNLHFLKEKFQRFKM